MVSGGPCAYQNLTSGLAMLYVADLVIVETVSMVPHAHKQLMNTSFYYNLGISWRFGFSRVGPAFVGFSCQGWEQNVTQCFSRERQFRDNSRCQYGSISCSDCEQHSL